MPEIKIILPDSSVKIMPAGSTPQQVADHIGPRLARDVVVAKVDTILTDLNTKLYHDCAIKLYTGDS